MSLTPFQAVDLFARGIGWVSIIFMAILSVGAASITIWQMCWELIQVARDRRLEKIDKTLKLAMLFLLLAGQAKAITLSTIQNDCRVLVKDTGTSRQRFSDAQFLRFINEAQKDANQQIYPIQKATQFELVSGTTFYAAPSDYLHILRMTRDYQVIKEQSLLSLDKLGEWQAVGGLPTSYYISFSSRSKIGFYPFPDSSRSTGTIRYDYIAQVTDLAAASDTPFNAIAELQPYGYILSFYCAYRAALIDGITDVAAAYLGEYQRGLSRMSEEATARPAYRPGVIGVTPGSRGP